MGRRKQVTSDEWVAMNSSQRSVDGGREQVASMDGPGAVVVPVDGADLYVERRGDGPPLLLITGGGGDCGSYTALADIMAADYTVLTYDRRGNSRSPLHHPPAPITIPEQSEDALAVLRASGFESGRIFGNSGGATIALDLAARHPQAVEAVVAHEPPLPAVLPDADQYLAAYDQIARTLDAEGWEAAFRMFQARIARIPRIQQPIVMKVLLKPASVLPKGPLLELMQRLSGNWEYLIRFEVQPFIRYLPDLDLIAAGGSPVALAAGADTVAKAERKGRPDDPYHKPALAIAERLQAEFAEFPGGLLAPSEIPEPFAATLRDVFNRLGS
jgi:pimeloyl-ACP methyl ester carboxylesterase